MLDIFRTAMNEQFLSKNLPQTVRILQRNVSFVELCSAKSSLCVPGFTKRCNGSNGWNLSIILFKTLSQEVSKAMNVSMTWTKTLLSTVILTFVNIFHPLNTYFIKLKTFFIQCLITFVVEKTKCVNFHLSACNERYLLRNTANYWMPH